MPVYEFDPPWRFVVGTVGPPGQRTFFLQARDEQRLVSVSCEKEQVAAIAERLIELLDELGGGAADPPAPTDTDDGPLETPIEDEFRVTTLSLGWDDERRVVLLEASQDVAIATEQQDRSDASSDTPDAAGARPPESVLRVVLSPAQARAFARRTQAVISAGRPPCPFCGGPLDASGHVCPRANGYRR